MLVGVVVGPLTFPVCSGLGAIMPGAHVLLPEGFDSHPAARYPLALNHGHFPADFEGFRQEPPDEALEPDLATRFAKPIPGEPQEDGNTHEPS